MSIGHADYFPNRGSTQPGCTWDISGSCSHNRAHEYYTESITLSSFTKFNSSRCYNAELCLRQIQSRTGFGCMGLTSFNAGIGNY